jgi:general secretion pathway protein I
MNTNQLGVHRASFKAPKCAGGFTLIEVLATLLLLAIVLPAVMRGITLATEAGSTARWRTNAAELARSKLAELVATHQWQQGTLSGDFSPDWPAYQWQASVQSWPGDTSAGLQQIDLTVTWTERNHPEALTLTTLAYGGAMP